MRIATSEKQYRIQILAIILIDGIHLSEVLGSSDDTGEQLDGYIVLSIGQRVKPYCSINIRYHISLTLDLLEQARWNYKLIK